ncbi:hypothetical protein BDA99DRAFT_534434 [Phascolomyces articulosus]|uniref:Uncharacterized protein n=1 Tax=Phascolomyces articulosus TaxID=60185 RepID=A0AAD5K572_9FUNG|nr:hypothetical protein BDA99DRAFT_534434 [Phascolomyces articulosus]
MLVVWYVMVTAICNGMDCYVENLTASSIELVTNGPEHGIVTKLVFPKKRAVTSNDDNPGYVCNLEEEKDIDVDEQNKPDQFLIYLLGIGIPSLLQEVIIKFMTLDSSNAGPFLPVLSDWGTIRAYLTSEST